MNNRPCLWLGGVLAVLLWPGLAGAQGEAGRTNVQAKGKLKAAAPGVLQVVNDDGDQWLVKLNPRSREIMFQGSADVSFLRPGMVVQFRSSFDKRGNPRTPVRQLKVFTPRENTPLGLIRDGDGLGKPGSFADVGDGEDKDKPQPETVSLLVAGTLRGIKDGKIAVAAGRALVRAPLAEKVQISVELADYRLARVGDTVEVQGWSYAGQEQVVYANRLTITAAKPLGAAEEKPKKGAAKAPDLNSLDGL